MKFDYYYGSQAEQFSFIRIPRAMLTDEAFTSLSLQAKVLFSVFLDRMSISLTTCHSKTGKSLHIIDTVPAAFADVVGTF